MMADPTKQRLVIEKPFGRDLSSAQSLNYKVRNVCAEEQIYQNRPLSRQRNRPKSAGFSLCQRDF